MRTSWVFVIGNIFVIASVASFAGWPAMADSGRVVARPAQTFRGWGMSLAWEANDLYGGGRQAAQITDPQLQSRYGQNLYGAFGVK